ncbi:hypothetical protein C5167_004795 [Papaver somniferum]|uniref:Uncharacterized protein n=1 Tax=Papaver somniferum TaxID=3469 RepID=A0A4Y7JC72_PAPSO|nr:hypothetical protein C5167_004795 [Papaver somniferum]
MASFDQHKLKEIQKEITRIARSLRLNLLLSKPFYVALRSIRFKHNNIFKMKILQLDEGKSEAEGDNIGLQDGRRKPII